MALDATNDGLWDWDMSVGSIYYSPRWATMLGYELGELPATIQTWKALLHPEDSDRVWQAIHDHHASRTSQYQVEYRLRSKDNSWRWVLARGKVVKRDAEGYPLRAVGTQIRHHRPGARG